MFYPLVFGFWQPSLNGLAFVPVGDIESVV